jgi:hypothetical protein
MQGAFIKIIFLGIYMNNNQKNLFSIGQIAESIGITRKIILNYETKGLIQPDLTTQTKSPKNRFPGDKMFLWFTY